jgi:HAE1 family hydrophobic/amphiphilic exporter-1
VILRSLPIAVILAAVLLSPMALLAQPQSQPEPPPPPVVPPRVGVTGTAPAAITIQDAIQMALEHNTDVAIARLAREAAEQDIRAAEGVYDVRLLPTFSYQRTVSPSTSELSGGAAGRLQERRLFGGVGVDALSPWGGGQLTVDFSGTRLESSNQFLRLNPQFPSAFGVSFTQPLLRGFRIDPARRQILLTRRAADLTAAQVSTVLMEQLALVEQAYWDVVFATRFLEVQVTALGQAQGQVASNERQAQQGTLAPIDVIEAETQAATFRQSVATAQQALAQAENRLKRLVLANRNAALWSQALVPTEPSDRDLPSITVEEALKLALAQRPELRESQVALEQNAIEQRFLADEARPRVDLVGTYTLSGLAGTALSGSGSQLRSSIDPAVLARLNALSALAGFDPVALTPGSPATLPGFLSGGLGESVSSIWARRFPTALAQVQVDLPIRNRTARANIARGLIARRELERRRDQTEQTVEADVRNALQAVESSRSRLDAASSARRNAQEQYESERRRFESGLSTVFLVLQRQTALVTAQGQEVRARTELNQAVALFDRATGGTLARYGVVLAD